ncbi:MAG: hypothetical protein Aureis2KO_28430 [Aureisphaera sp.]
MKKNYFVFALAAMLSFGAYAQFTDNMESYTAGAPICENWWTDWTADCSIPGIGSDATVRNGAISYHVPGDPAVYDPVLDLGSKIFGEWYLEFYFYVPSNKEGYFNFQGQVPIGAGEWVVGNIFFNQDLLTPGEGQIDNSALGAVTFNFPHDQWFRVYAGWDINNGISLATWFFEIDGVEVIPPGTAFTDSAGTTATSLGGVNFFSISANNEYFIDDMIYSDQPIGTGGIAELDALGVSMYPNPVQNVLNVQAKEAISSIAIFNVLGQQVYASNVDALSTSIDMSQMASGAYFVQVDVNGQRATNKIIK